MNNFKFSFLLIFVILFVFVLLVAGTMPYFIFYVFLSAILIPLIHSLIVLKRLKGSVDIPKGTLFTGEEVKINYNIKNTSPFSIPYLEIKSNIAKDLTGVDSNPILISLEKKASFYNNDTVSLKRRGFYELGGIEIKIIDVFKLYTFKKSISNNLSLLVYPEIIGLSNFRIINSINSGEIFVEDLSFADKNTINSLRDFREGDSIKSIHWRLSAKKSSPIIKEYDKEGDTEIILFIDNHKNCFINDFDRRLEDKSVEAALSIIDYCLNQNIEISLETQVQKDLIKISGGSNSDLKPFLDCLAKFKGNGNLSFNNILMDKIDSLRSSSTIIIITTNLDKEMGSLGMEMRLKNLNPIFIVIGDKTNKTGYLDLNIEKRLREEEINIFILDYEKSTKETLEGYYE
jgi:uncharacterized protein (DUF58 family)